ncbi:uncharacterized protein LOC129774138 [Toxorhynchites rutilus septentrionalis]|uniref:uncharacterized protein LOC129774138 n=1 Tax=Toxorhynchites rutilus septentrionalis TaxID=329112 RepID=UPI00247A2B80|nr:uncharacterized protein LOC129774138 [Toxorhynchites rutilus septentrionalis]
MPSTDLRQLAKQERQTRAYLKNVEEFLSNYQEERDRDSVEFRIKRLDEIFEKFCDVRLQIELLTDDHVAEKAMDDDEQSNALLDETQLKNARIYREFENQYIHLKKALSKKCESQRATTSAQHTAAIEVTQQSRTKYPELRLPTFSGKLSEWINFRDTFKSLIHDSHQLNAMDKFNYLRASLKDEALFQINQVQVIAANYTLAWSILETKYENHKLIAQEHLRALFNVSPMRCESFQGLNTLTTTFKIHLQQLEKLGERTENWSTLLAFMLSQKLDDDTFRHWETHYNSKNIPSYNAMIEFLDNH